MHSSLKSSGSLKPKSWRVRLADGFPNDIAVMKRMGYGQRNSNYVVRKVGIIREK